jgi:hypothetical protein
MYAGFIGLVNHIFVPAYVRYFKLKPNDQKVLFFEIDFKELSRGDIKYDDTLNTATPYGSYTVQLFYKGSYDEYTGAIDSIASNKIVIEYKESK